MGTKPYPILTCIECGETKSALHFPKRSGIYAERYHTRQVERYDKRCKWCHKPRYPGQKKEDVPRPKIRAKAANQRARHKRLKAERRAERHRLAQELTANEKRVLRRRKTRLKSMRYLASKGCEDCGIRDPRVLEYDHIDPDQKKRAISRLINDGFGWESRTLRREVKKCRILCANCHRVHTCKQQGYYDHEDLQREIGTLAARHKFSL